MFSDLGALSPLDGRYYSSAKELNAYFSEAALMQYRIYVEVEYLLALAKQKEIRKLLLIDDKEQKKLRKLFNSKLAFTKFNLKDVVISKKIATNHPLNIAVNA